MLAVYLVKSIKVSGHDPRLTRLFLTRDTFVDGVVLKKSGDKHVMFTFMWNMPPEFPQPLDMRVKEQPGVQGGKMPTMIYIIPNVDTVGMKVSK